jgi:hypothetical protein
VSPAGVLASIGTARIVPLTVSVAGFRHVFDCFECAIQKMAPICQRCGCRVVGHGVEVSGRFHCCAHCAREAEGVTQIRDRADAPDRTG